MADKIATRQAYGEALIELVEKNDKVVVLDADLANATQTCKVAKAHPEKFYNCGIAEANMVDIAAGMSTMGLIPYCSSFAMFAAGRKHRKRRAVGDEPHRGHTGGNVDHVGLGNAAVVEFFRVRLGDLAGLRGVGEVGVEHDDLIVLFDQFDQRFAVSLTGCNFISHVLSPPIPSKPARAARHWAPCRASRPDSP